MSYCDTFYKNPLYSDAIIILGNQEIPVHRIILDKIPYFGGLFKSTCSDSRRVILDENEISLFSIELLLKYVYNAKIDWNSLSLEEAITALRETSRFLYENFTEKLSKRVIDYGITDLSIEQRVLFLETIAEQNLEYIVILDCDFSIQVMSRISLDGLKMLISNGKSYSRILYKLAFTWIGCHPDNPIDDHITLLKLISPTDVPREVSSILKTYDVLPGTRPFLIEYLYAYGNGTLPPNQNVFISKPLLTYNEIQNELKDGNSKPLDPIILTKKYVDLSPFSNPTFTSNPPPNPFINTNLFAIPPPTLGRFPFPPHDFDPSVD